MKVDAPRGRQVARSGTSDIMINSLIAPQHSRLTHFDALLTLNASYSLFRLSPAAKQHSVVLLGPSLYRAVGIGTTVKQNIIGLSLTRKKTKASNQMVTRFCLCLKLNLTTLQFCQITAIGSNLSISFIISIRSVACSIV